MTMWAKLGIRDVGAGVNVDGMGVNSEVTVSVTPGSDGVRVKTGGTVGVDVEQAARTNDNKRQRVVRKLVRCIGVN